MSERADMRSDPAVEDALRIETHGFDYIPETERYLRPKQLFRIPRPEVCFDRPERPDAR
jgi:hypothetical protein